MTILKMIIFLTLLFFISASCATTPRYNADGTRDLSMSKEWKDWREPPPWSRY